MATKVRATISKKAPYYLSKHRYYELKHFCLQYDEWKSELNDILLTRSPSNTDGYHDRNYDDPVYGAAIKVTLLNDKIEMVERSVREAAPDIYDYLMLAVTKEKSYTYLKMELKIPCGKDYFYDRYRRFFFILDKKRN